MTADIWFLIAIIGFALSGITLIVAILMFIKMNIPSVIGDLNGKTVAREIRAMREANASAPQQGGLLPMYSRSRTSRLRGSTGSLKGNTGALKGNTGPLRKPVAPPQREAAPAPATDVLASGSAATDILSDNGAFPATELLTPNTTPATEVLGDNTTNPIPTGNYNVALADTASSEPVPFTVTRSMVFIHTTETI